MKRISYECNKCGKQIEPDGLYEFGFYKIDSNDGVSLLDMPNHMSDFEYENLNDKHYCETCIKNIVKAVVAEPACNAETHKEDLVAMSKHKVLTKVTKDTVEQVEITEAELRKLLVDERHSIREIAEMYGCKYKQIWNKANKLGLIIPKGKKDTVKAEPLHEIPSKPERPVMDVESVKEDYYVNKMTLPDMAKKYGVVVQNMISFMVKNHIGHQAAEVEAYMRQQGKTEERGY